MPYPIVAILDINTLNLYLVAGGLSISLSLVLLGSAHLQPGTWSLKSVAIAILMLSAGFTVSGFGPALPRWMTVIGTNMLLIGAGPVAYSGFAAFCDRRPVVIDRFGWSVVFLTLIPFWYWGLIEPNGNYRSAIFSLAVAVIYARTALLLLRTTRRAWFDLPQWTLAILFGGLAAGMAARGLMAVLVEPPPAPARGVNPTSWITVLGYMGLVSLVVACVIWLELGRPKRPDQTGFGRDTAAFSFVKYFDKKLQMLWATVLTLVLAIGGQAGLFYAHAYESEQIRLTRSAELTNDALAHHTQQIITQVDTILHSVRSFYLRTHSAFETERFINTLPFD